MIQQNKKRIAIDLDSTLNNLDDVWTEVISQDYSCTLTRADMKSWDASTWAPEGCEDIFEPLKRPGWFRHLGVQPHAQEVVEWLSQHYEIFIATAYHPSTCVDKTEWIKEHFPMIDEKHIIFINPKYLLNTDYLIDDGPHNIEAFPQTGVLVDAPWNEHLGDDYPRMKDWLEIKEFFELELTPPINWTEELVEKFSKGELKISKAEEKRIRKGVVIAD